MAGHTMTLETAGRGVCSCGSVFKAVLRPARKGGVLTPEQKTDEVLDQFGAHLREVGAEGQVVEKRT